MKKLTRTLATAALLTCVCASAFAQDSNPGPGNFVLPNEMRIGKAFGKFVDTTQIVAAYSLPAPKWMRARHMEAAVGGFTDSGKFSAFMSMGPVWRFPFYNDRAAIKLGFSPTVLSGTNYEGRDMGGHLHFTSSIALEFDPGRREGLVLALRVQHTSNGGLSSDNPGMDIISFGLEYR